MPIQAILDIRCPTIRLTGEINMAMAHEMLDELGLLHDYYQFRTVTLEISGPGGDALALNHLIDELEPWRKGECGRVLRTVGVNEVASAAALLLSFGTLGHRFARERSRLLYHSARTHFMTGVVQTGTDLRAANRNLETLDKNMIERLAEHIAGNDTGLKARREKEMKRLFRRERFIGPDAAKQAGLIDHVGRSR